MKSGYYTVEATFVMTICICVLMSLFYSGLYIHDRTLVRSEMNQSLADHFQKGGEATSEWRAKVKESIVQKLFLMKVQKLEVSKGLASVDMTLTYELPISIRRIQNIFTGGKSSVSLTVTREIVKPAEYKWDAMLAGDLLKKGGK